MYIFRKIESDVNMNVQKSVYGDDQLGLQLFKSFWGSRA